MSSYIPVSLQQQIEQFDSGQCRYCRTQEANSGIPLSFEHILPLLKGGQMNSVVVVSARKRWVASGWHPPVDLP